jgi:xylan 1,4-beta-xylosidase
MATPRDPELAYDARGTIMTRSTTRLTLMGVALSVAAAISLAGPRASAAKQASAQASSTPSGESSTPPVVIEVDAAHPDSAYQPAWNFFGADEPNYVYSPNGEKLLRELAALSPTPVHVRLHNLLTSGDGTGSLKWGSTNVYREDATGNPIYDWTITDRIFDALHDSGVAPLVEVGFMPEALSTNPEPYRHTFPSGSIFTGWSYPPKDYAKWSALVTAWATHLRDRYGAAEMHGWLWEVWNEPDIGYWHGTPEEYDRLYDVTTAAIRSVLPDAKIGGPDSTGPGGDRASAFLEQFLTHCGHGVNAATGGRGAPLDFISFHPKGAPTMVDGRVRMGIRNQLAAMDRGMKIVAASEFPSTPIILGESDPEGCGACSVATNPTEAYRNGPLYGVYVAEAEARTYELARKNGVNFEGSVTWALEFEGQPYFAGYRDLATNGVDKAVLNVFRMLGMLKGNWLPVTSSGELPVENILASGVTGAPDVNAIATRTAQEVDVLVWNYYDDDVKVPAAHVHVHVDGLPKKNVSVEQFRMDEQHSNAYRAWLDMGSPSAPTAQQQAALEHAGALAALGSPEKMVVKHGTLALPIDLPRQGVELVRIRWQ